MDPDTQPVDDVEVAPPQDDVTNADDEDPDHHDEACQTMTSQSKRWCVTAWPVHLGASFDPKEIDVQALGIDYMCWGLERTPTTQVQHYHFYFRFRIKKKMSTVIKIFRCNKVKCFIAKGTEVQCRDYCHKIGKHVAKQALTDDIGWVGECDPDIGKKGHRSDIDDVIESVVEHGSSASEIARQFPNAFIRMGRGIQEWITARQGLPPMIRQNFQVFYFWGASGVGKSYRVKMDADWAASLYCVPAGPHPWDGYQDQTTILLDEWNSEEWPLSQMNNYLDPYRLQLPCRYHNKYAAWLRVIICSNYSPVQAYAHVPSATARAAFLRRLKDHQACRLIEKREDEGGPSLLEIINSPPEPLL